MKVSTKREVKTTAVSAANHNARSGKVRLAGEAQWNGLRSFLRRPLEGPHPPNPDVHGRERNDRFTSRADLAAHLGNVRFPPKADNLIEL
jgi:hypothetical protein